MRERWLISVETVDGRLLTYKVERYDENDDWVLFLDERTNMRKKFHKSKCQIEEIPV